MITDREVSKPAGEAVVLVHGLAANRVVMRPLAVHLRELGYRTINWGYPSLWGNIEWHAQRLERKIAQLVRDPEVTAIQLVTHSMGSIIARYLLRQAPPPKLAHLVMLAPPNQGSRVASVLAHGLGWMCKPLRQLSDADGSFVRQLGVPAAVKIGVIAAAFDRVVAVQSTRLPAMHDYLVVPSGHTSMLFRRDVAAHVAAFLREGRFAAQRAVADAIAETA